MRKPQILIVEDEGIAAMELQTRLGNIGYDVCGVATSARAAVEQAKTKHPDLILMDIHLDGSADGVQAAERIHEKFDVPVIFLTAHADEAILERSKAVEPYGYLVKPYHEMALRSAIETALHKHVANRALNDYVAELEARNAELQAFNHTVAHGLKSMLTVVISGSELVELAFERMSVDEVRRRLHVISTYGHRMDELIQELLVLSEISQKEVSLRPLDMAVIVSGAQERLAAMIQEYEAVIIQPRTWPAALGHGPWVEEIWVNYLSNAMKYGGHPPRLRLGAARLPEERVRFWIEDNGPGIPPEDLDKVFTPFTRLNHNGDHNGHGLGLSIVQRIAGRLGGEVGVETREGSGCVFSFTLPAASLVMQRSA